MSSKRPYGRKSQRRTRRLMITYWSRVKAGLDPPTQDYDSLCYFFEEAVRGEYGAMNDSILHCEDCPLKSCDNGSMHYHKDYDGILKALSSWLAPGEVITPTDPEWRYLNEKV